jgi:uncharacterized protein (DUF302 family)
MNRPLLAAFTIGFLLLQSVAAQSPQTHPVAGLITKPSKYSVRETISRFETAVKSKGWVVFGEIDHAEAAVKAGVELRPRTVIVFGNPKLGSPRMQEYPTLAIDNPPKALVWEDDQGKVFLSFNSAEYLLDYVYTRHGVPKPSSTFAQFLDEVSDQATK